MKITKFFTAFFAIFALFFLPLVTYAQDSTITTRPAYAYAGVPASGTDEIDTLTIQSGTSSGTFTITVASGRTTAAITWSATDATLIARIDAALEALPQIGTGGCVVAAGSGSSGIGTYTITMSGKNAKQDFPALTVTDSLTGGADATLTTTTAGVAATWRQAPTGTLIVNSSTGVLYSNTSTTVGSPTWTAIVGIAVTTSAELAGILSNETGTGVAVFNTSPTLVTPTLGVATATTVNKVTLTAPATAATLTLIEGTTLTGPAASGTAATLAGTETLSNKTLTTPVIGAATGTSVTLTGGIRTSSATVPIGYNTGAGFAVTQATNKQTTVVSDTPAGVITMNNESLVNDTETTFQVTCASCAAIDVPMVAIASVGTAGKYLVTVSAVAAGSFKITVSNVGTTAGEAIVLNYVILKGAAN